MDTLISPQGPDFTFNVTDHSIYHTIQATNTIYVTFDPKEIEHALPAKKITVGSYEKFNFHPINFGTFVHVCMS